MENKEWVELLVTSIVEELVATGEFTVRTQVSVVEADAGCGDLEESYYALLMPRRFYKAGFATSVSVRGWYVVWPRVTITFDIPAPPDRNTYVELAYQPPDSVRFSWSKEDPRKVARQVAKQVASDVLRLMEPYLR